MMDKLIYYLLLVPISRLPLFVLYGISNVLYFIIYRIFRYRRTVVKNNLTCSFPEKSVAEIRGIERAFYRHLGDLIVESIKNFTISEADSKRRMKIVNVELLEHYFHKGQSVVLVGGHYNSWELFALAVAGQIKHTPLALYSPLKNKFWEKKITESRSKYGLHMLNIDSVLQKMKMQKEEQFAVIFGSDQSPRKSQLAHFTTFLNQETAVAYGAERMAREFDMPIIAGSNLKVARGQYKVVFTLISDNHCKLKQGEITKGFTKQLEKDILNAPQYWLWTHKRWKHDKSEHEVNRII
ncbi:lysophospholipid acyltransferase family protein [Muricauda sp. SCSIO 64092]|uniref:lysophospholipid acyltransferase family protein n=1 Tax=Allomuricauda sp. SCSIO 64092 TaxID=2908842 RepID=UPI001FF28973|nr:lysophospholipid acyltransferase family protein [Muricauda sp. SCSIO 64092]UOY06791.1 lysophospholipid acyltransferase family protein [Muricauda sp. SCSIO 64092]